MCSVLVVQVENWGEVEGGHDIDRGDSNARVSSALFLLRVVEHYPQDFVDP